MNIHLHIYLQVNVNGPRFALNSTIKCKKGAPIVLTSTIKCKKGAHVSIMCPFLHYSTNNCNGVHFSNLHDVHLPQKSPTVEDNIKK